MPQYGIIRVVVVRKGKVKPTEFRLRNDETALSLFRAADVPHPEAIIAAVRASGKQGDLGMVEIPVDALRRLGLVLVRTPGGTPDPVVNAAHAKARPALWRRLVLRMQRVPIHEWFNECIAPELAAEAKLVE